MKKKRKKKKLHETNELLLEIKTSLNKLDEKTLEDINQTISESKLNFNNVENVKKILFDIYRKIKNNKTHEYNPICLFFKGKPKEVDDNTELNSQILIIKSWNEFANFVRNKIDKLKKLNATEGENKAPLSGDAILSKYVKWKNKKRKEKENTQSQIEDIKKKHYIKNNIVPFIMMPEIPKQCEYCIEVEKKFRRKNNITSDIDSEFFVIKNHPGNVGHWDTIHVKSVIRNEKNQIKSAGTDLSCGAYTLINIIKSNKYFLNLPKVQAMVNKNLFNKEKLNQNTSVNNISSLDVRKFLSVAIELNQVELLKLVPKKDIQLSLERIKKPGIQLTDQDIQYVCLALDLPLYQLKAFQVQETDLSQITENTLNNLIKNRPRNSERGRNFEKENKEELEELKTFCEEKKIDFEETHKNILHNKVTQRENTFSLKTIQNKFFRTPDFYIRKIRDSFKKANKEKAKNNYIDTLEIIQAKRAFFPEKDDYKNIEKCLTKLSSLCLKQARSEKSLLKFSDFFMEALIYNNAAWMVNNKFIKEGFKEKNFLFKQTAFEIQVAFLKKIDKNVSKKNFLESLKKYHTEIKLIESKVSEKMEEMNKISFEYIENKKNMVLRAEQVFSIYNFITDKIKKLLVSVFEDCEKILGKPEFSYSIICFGSLAKQLATNYSDIEFGILLDECNKCDKEESIICEDCSVKIEYIKKLSYLFAMNVINFKQTTISKKMLNENTNLDDILERGIQLDPGEKTPLKDGEYMLIQTPRRMVAKYLSDAAYKIDPLLPSELMRANHLYGDSEITKKYKIEIRNFFSRVKNKQSKSLKRARRMLEDDLLKYGQNNPELILKSPNVKQEIYRPFTALLEGFALYCEELDCDISTFQYINSLLSKGKFGFNEEIADSFKIALGIALEFRLQTYHNYHKKKDEVHLIKPNKNFLKETLSSGESLFQFSKEEAVLFDKLCFIKRGLCCFLRRMLNSVNTEEVLLKDFFTQSEQNSDQRYNVEEKIFKFIQMLQKLIEIISSKNKLATSMEKMTSEAQLNNSNLNDLQTYFSEFLILLLNEESTKPVLLEMLKCDLFTINPLYCYRIIEEMLNQIKVVKPDSQVTKILGFIYYFCTEFKNFKKDFLQALNIDFIDKFFKDLKFQEILKNIYPQVSISEPEEVKKLLINWLKELQLEDGNELKKNIEPSQSLFELKKLDKLIEKLKVFHSEKNYKEQSFVYGKISWIYFKENKFIDAITFYNFGLGALKKWTNSELKSSQLNSEFILESSNLKQKLQLGITTVENGYLTSIGRDFKLNSYNYKTTYHLHRKYLSTLRKQVKKDIHSNSIPIKEIYENISSAIKKLVVLLVSESIQILGEPPCAYAVIGLGSLARNEATPYSDFEWAILISDENCKVYFKQLTELMNIKILNLGETSPKIAYIDQGAFSFSFDYSKNPVCKGFAFDSRDPSGCKLPLGNSHLPKEKQFKLIKTPRNLLKYQSDDWFKIHRNLPIILNNITFITGEVSLVHQYQTLLQEYVVPWVKQSRAKRLLLADIMKFEPQVGRLKEDGRIFPVKYELYRLPSLVFDAFALYYGLNSTNTLARIKELRDRNFLNASVAQRLEYCFDKISKLRLENYLKNGEQADDLVIDANQDEKLEELYKLYEILIYLLDCSYDFAVNDNNRFKKYDFKTDNSLAKVRIYEKLLDYDQVIKICTGILNDFPTNSDENIDNENWITIKNRLGLAYLYQDQFKDAASVFKNLIERDVQHVNPALHVNYACILDKQGQYEKALKQLSLAEKIVKELDNVSRNITAADKIYSAAEIFSQRGVTLQHKGYYNSAIQCLLKAVNYESSVFSGLPTPAFFRYQHNLAIGLMEVGRFNEAHSKYDEFIKNVENQFGSFHPHVANGLYNKSEAFFIQGKYSEALKCAEKALRIYTLEENNQYEAKLGSLFNNMASIHIELGDNPSAFKYIDLSLEINQRIYGENHKLTILSYLTLMRVYGEEKKEEEVTKLFDTVEKSSCFKEDMDLQAQCYIQRSSLWLHLVNSENKNKLQRLKKGLEDAEKAIDIAELLFKKVPSDKHRRNWAYYLNNKGAILVALEEYESAKNCFKESFKKLGNFFKDCKHPHMITCCLSLGKLYMENPDVVNLHVDNPYGFRDISIALDYFKQALEIQKELYTDSENRSLFEIYQSIAYALYRFGELGEALYYIKESRKIASKLNLKIDKDFEKIYGDIEKSYENIVTDKKASHTTLWAFTANRLRKNTNKEIVKTLEKMKKIVKK